MALPLLRWSCRRTTAVINSYFKFDRFIQNKTITKRLAPLGAVVCGGKSYSSDRDGGRQSPGVVVFSFHNPLVWVRTRIYHFLIKTYFDKDFSFEEFTKGAIHAFSHVSHLLSQCQFDALEGLVANDLVGKLKDKCADLPLSHKKALFADPDEIIYSVLWDMGIYYDDKGRRFVSILMRYLYFTSVNLPRDPVEGAKVFQITVDKEGKSKRLVTALYEFQREFTQGVTPDWTITRIEHSNLLD
ncbi:m-AAA protease-interacting protein 1, mitochondrial [Salminus brasiliensis]|uniref:m-AAA protease-interacting protein 1, mitochondrial n=1 Tax=Salminus brasiliensis TaxID=930266 RepID=UPI003B8352D7